jgi:hypothetical protein
MPSLNRALRRAAMAAALLLSSWISLRSATLAAEGILLSPPDEARPTRVKVVLEVDGQLLTPPPTKTDAGEQSHPLKAKGQFLYEERAARQSPASFLRFYEQAEAEISIDGRPSRTTLRDDRRFIETETTSGGVTFRSLQGALSREELELIELPAGSQLADQLLPGREVKPGEIWTHDDHLLANMLNLSAVTANEVTSQLKAIDDAKQLAHIQLQGKLIGSVAGVITEIQLEGKYSYDLRQHRVTWLAFGIHEQRESGLTKPGLNVHARVRMLVEQSLPEHLTTAAIKELAAQDTPPADLLEYQPPHGRFTLVHDRRWHVFSARPELIVMRLIDDGQFIAQCNLHTLPVQGGKAPTSLGQFQEDIRTALGSRAQQIVDSTESNQPGGLRQLRVHVVGKVAETPVQWIYYHLSNSGAQSLTCVFTMSGEDVEQFGSQDVSFVNSITLQPAGDDAGEQAESSDDVARRPPPVPSSR